jgi:hypothetical protein
MFKLQDSRYEAEFVELLQSVVEKCQQASQAPLRPLRLLMSEEFVQRDLQEYRKFGKGQFSLNFF